MFLEISQNSQENTCARVSFLIKLQASQAIPDAFCNKSLSHFVIPEAFCNESLSHSLIPDTLCIKPLN